MFTRATTRRAFLTGTGRMTAGLALAAAQPGAVRAAVGPPVVDTHMHVWSDDAKRFPFAHPYEPNFKPPPIPASLEILRREMDASGVSHCVLVQTIYHGWDNSYLVHCLRAEPRRFRGQGLIDPSDPNVAERLEFWMTRHGLAGMRFSPIYYQGKDDWLGGQDALWKKAEDLQAIFNYFIATPQLPRLEDRVRRYPRVRVVIDHLARIDLKAKDPLPEFKKLLALAKYPNVWVKVSELGIVSATGAYPFRDTFPWVRRLYDAFGPGRLLWGTGFPGATRAQAGRPSLQQELDLVRQEIDFLTAADREKILGRNAVNLWGFAS